MILSPHSLKWNRCAKAISNTSGKFSKIAIEWNNTAPVTTVDFEFTALTDDTTYVVIKNYGFQQTGDDLIEAIKDNTGGYTTVLDGLKAWLEFGIELNLVRDKFPHGI